MWPLQALYDALPTDWDIYQIILLADSTTFASYMTNLSTASWRILVIEEAKVVESARRMIC